MSNEYQQTMHAVTALENCFAPVFFLAALLRQVH
jgi:hypothetical protein